MTALAKVASTHSVVNDLLGKFLLVSEEKLRVLCVADGVSLAVAFTFWWFDIIFLLVGLIACRKCEFIP